MKTVQCWGGAAAHLAFTCVAHPFSSRANGARSLLYPRITFFFQAIAPISTVNMPPKGNNVWANAAFLEDLAVALYEAGDSGHALTPAVRAGIEAHLSKLGHSVTWNGIRYVVRHLPDSWRICSPFTFLTHHITSRPRYSPPCLAPSCAGTKASIKTSSWPYATP